MPNQANRYLALHNPIFSSREHKLGVTAKKAMNAILSNWPTNPLDVAREIGEDSEDIKSLSAKYLYHFKKLRDMELIRLKRLGRTYVAWPADIEKLRVLHEMVREE